MFYTVFSTNDSPYMQWQSELLEHSWKQAGQEGELIRLVATHTPDALPVQKYARCVATRCWDVHPQTGDKYPIYNKPASLLEWVYRERPEGTVLLLDPDCVFRKPVKRTVAPGYPAGQDWIDFPLGEPGGETPFGLPQPFSFLKEYCARVDLPTDSIMIPTLIHTTDLRRIAARWLELCGVVRDNYADENGKKMWESDMIAYLATCGEYGLRHEPINLGVATNWDEEAMPDSPIIHYCQAIHDGDGETLFNKHTYKPWSLISTQSEAAQYYGRDLVAQINGFIASLPGIAGAVTGASKPLRRFGVMEGRVLDQLLLELPEQNRSIWLNQSGMAVWDLCDGNRSVDAICQDLSETFDADADLIAADIFPILGQLQAAEFIALH